MRALQVMNGSLEQLSRTAVLALATSALFAVGAADYLSGYELSLSVFYLVPVALASWYAGRSSGISMAILSCLSWYIADMAANHPYSNAVIPVWNALVRLAFFLITALLLTALRASLRAQLELARSDALTGLYGRREFGHRLQHDLALAQRRQSALTLAYVDADNFKAVNDTYGHEVGDRVLQAIADAMKKSFRAIDTLARLGGDEFALILPDTDGDKARQIFARFEREFLAVPELSDLSVSCSIGVVTFLNPVTLPEQALAAADQLMYEVKRGGKAAVAFRVLGEAVRPDATVAARHAHG